MEVYHSECLSVSCAELRLARLACSGDAKSTVAAYMRHVETNVLMRSRGIPVPRINLHKLFYGGENCGKEELAVLIGQFYSAYGLLDRGHTVAVSSDEFFDESGKFAACDLYKKALGGVLYVRGVERLCASFEDEEKELITSSFIKALRSPRLAVIIGDSRETISKFFDNFPALCEPFGVDNDVSFKVNSVSFSNLSSNELYNIFEQRCQCAGLMISNEASERLKTYIDVQFVRREVDNLKTAVELFKCVLEKHNSRVTKNSGAVTNVNEILTVDLP
jgi:hypothetical protein